jgi:uncharacterized Zn finger protein (UPF0148 family)
MRKSVQIELQHQKRIVKNADAKLNRVRKGKIMWQKKCPVCRLPMEKARPTETVACVRQVHLEGLGIAA